MWNIFIVVKAGNSSRLLWTAWPRKMQRIAQQDIRHCPRLWRFGPTRASSSSFLTFLDHTQRRITVGRTPLDE